MNIQLKKLKQGRRRFIKTAPLANPLDWMTELAQLKEWIALSTQFQIVGRKTFFEVVGNELSLMVEVVGVPRNLDQNRLILMDLEALETYVYDFSGADLFSVQFESVLVTSAKIRKALGVGENRLHDVTHLVFDEEKIALHFFRQKDYSQNLLS